MIRIMLLQESTPLMLKSIYKKLRKGLAVHQPMKWLNWRDHDSLAMDEGISDRVCMLALNAPIATNDPISMKLHGNFQNQE